MKQPVQEPESESTKQTNVDSSNNLSSQKGIKKIRKPQFNRKGLLFHEVYVLVSPASHKRQALDMAQKLQKKKRKSAVQFEIFTVETDHDGDSERSDIRIEDSVIGSPQRDSPQVEFRALPPISSPITTSVPVSTISPTYSTIMHEAIITLFSSQSTEAQIMIHDKEPNNDEIMVSFADLQVDPGEENVPDNLIMSGNQLKILNSKIHSLLQIQADTGGRKFLTGIEREYLLKAQEIRFLSLVEGIEQKQAERLVIHSKSFDYEIQKLCDVAKERHDLFVEQVSKMKESVDLKIVELKFELSKEVQKMEKNYTLLHGKVDVNVTVVTKLVEFNSEYMNKLEVKSEKDSQVFKKMEKSVIKNQGVYFQG
ncbi:unnamed protein product [Lactuca virosa]|uniref:Uncharacterized protein n=1 Tax=Lactuca virosa TaxID=75947 RepID=A0AAU9LQ36_9ASTR|nr:unnamed protein product [Lactuca virosa]